MQAWDGARVQLGSVEGALHTNETRLRVARANLKAAQAQIEQRLVELYVSPSPDFVTVLAGATSLSDLIDRIEAVNVFTAQDSAIAQQAQRLQRQVSRRETLLQDQRRVRTQTLGSAPQTTATDRPRPRQRAPTARNDPRKHPRTSGTTGFPRTTTRRTGTSTDRQPGQARTTAGLRSRPRPHHQPAPRNPGQPGHHPNNPSPNHATTRTSPGTPTSHRPDSSTSSAAAAHPEPSSPNTHRSGIDRRPIPRRSLPMGRSKPRRLRLLRPGQLRLCATRRVATPLHRLPVERHRSDPSHRPPTRRPRLLRRTQPRRHLHWRRPIHPRPTRGNSRPDRNPHWILGHPPRRRPPRPLIGNPRVR